MAQPDFNFILSKLDGLSFQLWFTLLKVQWSYDPTKNSKKKQNQLIKFDNQISHLTTQGQSIAALMIIMNSLMNEIITTWAWIIQTNLFIQFPNYANKLWHSEWASKIGSTSWLLKVSFKKFQHFNDR